MSVASYLLDLPSQSYIANSAPASKPIVFVETIRKKVKRIHSLADV
jgi:hypothetical protein